MSVLTKELKFYIPQPIQELNWSWIKSEFLGFFSSWMSAFFFVLFGGLLMEVFFITLDLWPSGTHLSFRMWPIFAYYSLALVSLLAFLGVWFDFGRYLYRRDPVLSVVYAVASVGLFLVFYFGYLILNPVVA